ATEGSVTFSDPLPLDATQQQQAQRMMLMRSGRAPGPAKNNAPAANLYTTLKAEWPLSSKTVEDLLIESQDLETKIKGADLSGTNEKLSAAEQQELAEEAQGLNNGDGQPNPRDPVFLFAAKISIQDRDAARGDAFKKARADAESLARAAGGQLGSIRLLAAQATSTSNPFADPTYGGYRQRGPYMPAGPSDDDPLEAVGPQPAKVTYRVTVYVSFALK
ncbi:MAG TPA: SIMPL domain-containing protein, partial [Tepidisphaeraceae bacterium]|nr:SIMPL domain-containing protein [Tepidisphaeraceae bacterium]